MFFSKLDQLLQDGQTLNLNLLKKGGKIHINLVPKVHKMSEEAKNKLIPLSLSGTAAELDQDFFRVISEPIQERLGLISNVDAFKKNTKVAASDDKFPGTGQAAGTKKDHKSSKKEQMIAEAEAHEKANRWPNAYAIYKKLSAAEPANQKLKEKAMDVWGKMAQKPLFNFDAEVKISGEMNFDTEDDESADEDMGDGENDGNSEVSVPTDFAEPVLNTSMVENTSSSSLEENAESPVDMFANIMAMANNM